MKETTPARKPHKRLIALSVAALASIALWLIGLNVNVYRNAFLGGFFELVWLPNLLATFCIPLLAVSFWISEKLSIRSGFLYLFAIYAVSVLILWNHNFG